MIGFIAGLLLGLTVGAVGIVLIYRNNKKLIDELLNKVKEVGNVVKS
jgi:flagellar biosynthesis protein FliR